MVLHLTPLANSAGGADGAPLDALGEHRPGGHMLQQHLGQSLLVGQEAIESLLGNLGESVVGGGEDGEGLGVLDSVHQAGSGDGGDQGGESVIGDQSVDQVTLGDEHDSVNEVNNAIAGLNIGLDDSLAVDSDGWLSIVGVHIDPEAGALGRVEGEVIGGLTAHDVAGDHVIEEDALQKLGVGADSVNNRLGQSGKSLVGWGEHGEGSLTGKGVGEAGLDSKVDKGAGPVGGELLHQVAGGLGCLSAGGLVSLVV